MAYIGNSLSTDVGVNQYEYTATSGQTDFACVYDTTVDVYLNGLRLAETDYSKPDGLKIVLAVGATAGDIVTINAFENVATISKAPSDFTVIGDLDVGGTLTVGNTAGSVYSLAKLDSGTLFYTVPDGTSRWVRVASWEHTTNYSNQHGVFRIAGRFGVDTFTVETRVTNPPNNGYQADILQDNPSIAADHIRVLADYSGSTTLVELWIYCLAWGGNYYATLDAYYSHNGVSGITLESGNPAQTTPPTGVSNTHSNTDNLDADTLDGLQVSNLLRSDASDTYSGGLLTVNNTAGEDIITATGAIDGLQVFQPTAGADALMTFHVSGDYACHFGLDGGINDLVVGGWSFGGNSYKIWHQGNDGAGSGLDADTLDNLNSTAFGRLATASNWSRTQSYDRVTLTDAATINWDMSLSPSAIVSLSANRTMGNPTNVKAGNWYTLRVYHSGAPRTLAWSSYWKFGGNGAPALSTVAGRYDVLTFYAHTTTALTFVGITLHTAGA